MKFDFKHDCAPPRVLWLLLLCPWMWGIFFFFLVGPNSFLSMVVQQLVVILVFLQEKMSTVLLCHLAKL